jgi:hypothetical protein
MANWESTENNLNLNRRRALGLISSAVIGPAFSTWPTFDLGSETDKNPPPDPLVPANWSETDIKINPNFHSLPNLPFLDRIQFPMVRIPFLRVATFYAPPELPDVTIGLYYQKDSQNLPIRRLLDTNIYFYLLSDLNSAFSLNDTQVVDFPRLKAQGKITEDQVFTYQANQPEVIANMEASSIHQQLAPSYDFDFITICRPDPGVPTVLAYSGYRNLAPQDAPTIPPTFFAERLVFTE